MENDHMYNSQNTFSQDEIVLQTNINTENIDTISNAGDTLLIDLVRGYPHLYNKTSPNFKDAIMKENSWEEIAKILTWSPTECQNRWIRLRERFSRERREIEAESKSGSGASSRQGFILYENMKFLNNHVQRRRTITNILNKKNKENIPRTSPTSSLTINRDCNSPSVSITSKNQSFRPISLHPCTEPTDKIKPSGNLEIANDIETNDEIQSRSESLIFETSVERPERCSSGSSASREFSTPTPPIARHRDKNDRNISTPRKRQKSESDDIEKSFLSLSATIANKIQNPNMQSILNKNEKDAEDKFAELIVVELRNMPEKERKEKKKKIMDILWS